MYLIYTVHFFINNGISVIAFTGKETLVFSLQTINTCTQKLAFLNLNRMHKWLLMATKGCAINKGLASVKFCNYFSPHLSTTPV